MFSIGLFSKMNRITTKTLRHYDKIGLLKPAYTDESNGYRYYTSEQLPRLHKIITLKQMGLNLVDIIELVERNAEIETYLKLKENEVKQNILNEEAKLRQIKSYLLKLKGENTMYNPILKTLPEVIVASMRMIAPNYNSYFELIPRMGDEMRRVGAICAEPAYCFNIYHDGEYKEKDIDVEVCEAVIDFCENSEMVTYKKIPEIPKAVCILHKGPYETLGEAYAYILKWIEENNFVITDPIRESYIDGIWNKENKEDWLTEIQVPIR